MPANSYGIIVEGESDSMAYEAIIRNLASHDVRVKPLTCGGRARLMQKFPAYLEALKREVSGGPVDMAIVIQDADGRAPDELENTMRSRIKGRRYPFPVHCYVARQAMEAWLLADVNAINTVIKKRAGKQITRSRSAPEDLPNPKVVFRQMLTEYSVGITPMVCSEIAKEIDLDVLSQACPRFPAFAELVDC